MNGLLATSAADAEFTPLETSGRCVMPAKSKKQQMAAGAALSAKRGERPKSSLKGASKQMADSMSEKELDRMASVKRRKLPTRNRKSKSR